METFAEPTLDIPLIRQNCRPILTKRGICGCAGREGKYGGEKCTQGIVGNPAIERKLGRSSHRWESNIGANLQ
jgi:hypothetical protein